MIGLTGTLLLSLSLATALLQMILPLIGHTYKRIYLLASARPLAIAQFTFILCAYVLLTLAFIKNDFTIAYVAANSHPSLPFMYRVTALWGAHEGSILLWVFILNIWALIVASTQKTDQLPLILSMLASVSVCFLGFLLLTSNPFLPATEILPGQDLNPLLQDPGFVIHPPMLYMGYVGFSVAFAITLAKLMTGQLDKQWAQLTSRYTLLAWCFLTLGITLGSWWAYRVLGWGGFWFWDPVENASLLPWLAGTALLHTLLLVEKRLTAKPWAVFLALICFVLSLLGTFLVRSGLLISSHTFASDPKRGIFLLAIMSFMTITSLIIYIIRFPTFNKVANKQRQHWMNRETLLLLNSLLFFVGMLTVLLGTLYPLILDALHLGTISVGPPYFNKVMLPIVLMSMALMSLLPLFPWQTNDRKISSKTLFKHAWMSIGVTLVGLWFFANKLSLETITYVSLSIFIILNTFRLFPYLRGMVIAHTGFVVFILGILFSTFFNQEREVRLHTGQSTHLGPYQFFFTDVNSIRGPNYHGMQGKFEVVKGTQHITFLQPEKRIYPVRDMVMTKVAIHPGIFRDLYIALGEPFDDDTWSLRLYYKPFVRWIWLGGLLMMLGGLLALTQKTKGLSHVAS